MGKAEAYRERLRVLPAAEWEAYLCAESGLPGPRGNLELAQAVVELVEGEPDGFLVEDRGLAAHRRIEALVEALVVEPLARQDVVRAAAGLAAPKQQKIAAIHSGRS